MRRVGSLRSSRTVVPAVTVAVVLATTSAVAMASTGPEADGAPTLAWDATRTVPNPDTWRSAELSMLGRTPAGRTPNGVATEPAISFDSRAARYVAYTSTATNIAKPVTPGRRNVFLVARTGRITADGNAWAIGATRLLSVGRGGVAADGDSWGAALSGYSTGKDRAVGPRLVAFLSTATNLVAGSGGGTTGAYVGSVRGGRLQRIDAPGEANGVALAGNSSVVAVTTSRGLYVRRAGKVRRLVGGSARSPSVTDNGAQVAYEKGGRIYLVTVRGGKRRRIARGTEPRADAGAPSGRGRGNVRAVSYRRGRTVRRAEIVGSRVRTRSYGRGVSPRINAGGSGVAFGSGPDVRLRVNLLGSGRAGGYARPQGTCTDGTAVTGVAVSARYNYVAFTCAGGALLMHHVGGR